MSRNLKLPEIFTHSINGPAYQADCYVPAKLTKAGMRALIEATVAATIASLGWVTIRGRHVLIGDSKTSEGKPLRKPPANADLYRSSKKAASTAKTAPHPAKAVKLPTGPEDVERFITEAESSKEAQEISRRFEQYVARSKSGDPTRWSLEANSDANGDLTPERQHLHERLIKEFLPADTVALPNTRPQLMMLLGAPGSGKSSAGQPYINKMAEKMGIKFAVANSDDVKVALPEYKGWNAGLLHEESAQITEGDPKEVSGEDHSIVFTGMKNRHNLVLDGTGKNGKKYNELATIAGHLGYDVHIIHVATPPYVAVGRAWKRFADEGMKEGKKGGRYVPPRYAYYAVDHKPDETYEIMKKNPFVKSWHKFTTQNGPELLEEGQRK